MHFLMIETRGILFLLTCWKDVAREELNIKLLISYFM